MCPRIRGKWIKAILEEIDEIHPRPQHTKKTIEEK